MGHPRPVGTRHRGQGRYIVYHRHPLGDPDGNHRQVCIEEMRFDAKGLMHPVKLTTTGVAAQPLR